MSCGVAWETGLSWIYLTLILRSAVKPRVSKDEGDKDEDDR
jgi:hypothetical protein